MKTSPFLVGLLLAAGLVPAQAAQFGDFDYGSDGTAVTITRYTGSGGAVTIPDTIEGLPVTSIGDRAFKDCTNLTSVTFPNSVTSIGYAAFSDCCSLTSVTIGNRVTSIGGKAFSGCTELTAITVAALNSVYSSLDGVVFNKDQTLLILYPAGRAGSYTIPDGVSGVYGESGCFMGFCWWFGAFSGCSKLTRITIPDSVTTIGDAAFEACTGLTNAAIGDSVTLIGRWAFSGCTSLTCVTIPSNVTSIGHAAFYGCSSLISLTIPDSVTSIGAGAFELCTSLTDVTIPDSVTSIEDAAFSGCASLTSVAIPNSVTSIGGWAFRGCSSMSSVRIGSGVTSIGDWAFSGCTNLGSVQFEGNASEAIGGNIFGYWTEEGEYLVAPATVYYLPGATGWGSEYGELPTAPWARPNPAVLDFGPSFGVQANGFGFRISWATNANVVVEAAADIANPTWSAVSTNTLTDGWFDFTDPNWAQYPTRLYRVRQE